MKYIACFLLTFTALINSYATKTQPESGPVRSYVVDSVFFNGSSDTVCNNPSNTSVCLRKCCDVNYILKGTLCVFNTSIDFGDVVVRTSELLVDFDNASFVFDVGMVQCLGWRDGRIWKPEENFSFLRDGRLWLPGSNDTLTSDGFCLEYLEDVGITAFICHYEMEFPPDITAKLQFIGMGISIPFLLITFVVYALVPERNLHGTCLMCYVFTLLVANSLIILTNLVNVENACLIIEGLYLFSFTASMCWLNVMSYDIWSRFSGCRGFPVNRKRKQVKRFLVFSFYAWGVPSFLIILIACLRKLSSKQAWYNPNPENNDCLLAGVRSFFLYYCVPLSTFIMVNLILFIKTVCKVKRWQKGTGVLKIDDENRVNCFRSDKHRMCLYVKLLVAMGVNWSTDVTAKIFWLVGDLPAAVWYFPDFCNAAFGMFIFFTFVFNRRTWRSLKTRCSMTAEKSKPVAKSNLETYEELQIF